MSVLKEVLESGRFAVTAELAPPKGADMSAQVDTAVNHLKDSVHAVNVTDMQSACLKASSFGLCIKLKEAGIEPIMQTTGRDRNRMAIMGDFLAAASFGIDTMFASTGDHTIIGDCKEAKPVFDLDSVGILQMMTDLEETGLDCGGNKITGPVPSFYKGACVSPVYDPIFLQINKLRMKVNAGAEYVQTQGIFTVEHLKRFMDEVDKANIDVHVMAGIIPLKGAGMARYMNANVPGIDVPEDMIKRLDEAAARGKASGIKGLPAKEGIEMAAELIARIKEEKLCGGVHIMTVGAEANVPVILKKAGIEI